MQITLKYGILIIQQFCNLMSMLTLINVIKVIFPEILLNAVILLLVNTLTLLLFFNYSFYFIFMVNTVQNLGANFSSNLLFSKRNLIVSFECFKLNVNFLCKFFYSIKNLFIIFYFSFNYFYYKYYSQKVYYPPETNEFSKTSTKKLLI